MHTPKILFFPTTMRAGLQSPVFQIRIMFNLVAIGFNRVKKPYDKYVKAAHRDFYAFVSQNLRVHTNKPKIIR